MKVLTDAVREQVKSGWKVAIEQDGALAVYDVIVRDDDEVVGKKRWVRYPKDSGKPLEEVNQSLPDMAALSREELQKLRETQTVFARIRLSDIVSCLSAADGNLYGESKTMEKYGTYE